jgi:hypothetical protein
MKRLPTKTAEKVYEILCKFTNADPNYYEKESFVYHFGVLSEKSADYKLSCTDDRLRTFHCTTNGNMWVDGVAVGKANAILKKVSEELKNSRA